MEGECERDTPKELQSVSKVCEREGESWKAMSYTVDPLHTIKNYKEKSG